MAQALLAESKLRLVFEVGMDQDGEPILQSKTFSNIKKEATEVLLGTIYVNL